VEIRGTPPEPGQRRRWLVGREDSRDSFDDSSPSIETRGLCVGRRSLAMVELDVELLQGTVSFVICVTPSCISPKPKLRVQVLFHSVPTPNHVGGPDEGCISGICVWAHDRRLSESPKRSYGSAGHSLFPSWGSDEWNHAFIQPQAHLLLSAIVSLTPISL
jgi:hypothetical protein